MRKLLEKIMKATISFLLVSYVAASIAGFIYFVGYQQQKQTEIITSYRIRICEDKGGEYSISKWGGEYEESCRTKMREIEL